MRRRHGLPVPPITSPRSSNLTGNLLVSSSSSLKVGLVALVDARSLLDELIDYDRDLGVTFAPTFVFSSGPRL